MKHYVLAILTQGRIPDLEEYLLVAQDSVRVEHFVRQTTTMWTMTEYTSLGATIDLPSLQAALPIRTIYEDLELPEEADAEQGYLPEGAA